MVQHAYEYWDILLTLVVGLSTLGEDAEKNVRNTFRTHDRHQSEQGNRQQGSRVTK